MNEQHNPNKTNINGHTKKECLSCWETMERIYCYSIRKVCRPCGGKSLVIYEPPRKNKKTILTAILGGLRWTTTRKYTNANVVAYFSIALQAGQSASYARKNYQFSSGRVQKDPGKRKQYNSFPYKARRSTAGQWGERKMRERGRTCGMKRGFLYDLFTPCSNLVRLFVIMIFGKRPE